MLRSIHGKCDFFALAFLMMHAIVVLPMASAQQSSLSFAPAVAYHTGGTEPTFVAVGDFNGDGSPDLAVANSYLSDTIGILLANGDGTFLRPVSYRTGGYANTIIPIDLNGDGILDLVVSNQSRCFRCGAEGSISVFIGNGDGTFRLDRAYDSGGISFENNGFGHAEMAVADLNGDGHLDIVIINCAAKRASACGGGADGVISVLFGNGDGTFQTAVNRSPGIRNPASGLALGDVNGDGKLDVVLTSGLCSISTACGAGKIDVLLGNGDGSFRAANHYATNGFGNGAVTLADLNQDGFLDVVTGGCGLSNCWDGNGVVTVFLGNGDGSFQPAANHNSGGRLADGIAVADFDGDGHLDIVVGNVVDDSVGVLLGNGDGSFRPATIFPVLGGFAYGLTASDVNGDGKVDILVTSQTVVNVLLNSSK